MIAVDTLQSWKFDVFHNAEMQEYKDEALSFISSVSVGNSHQDQAAHPPLIPFTEVFKVYIITQMLATYQCLITGT